MAVSKTHPAAAIEAAYERGQRDFGENYVQELVDKAEKLRHLAGLRFHLIGHLQTNKARAVAPVVASVQTVASARLVSELGARVRTRRAPELGPLPILLEVNIGGEAQKSGCSPQELEGLLSQAETEQGLVVSGLMTVPPITEPEESLRYFEELAELREALGGAARLPELSMGMSHDFRFAIQAGATQIRVGTAIFGTRPRRELSP
jgi:hypothetical protein